MEKYVCVPRPDEGSLLAWFPADFSLHSVTSKPRKRVCGLTSSWSAQMKAFACHHHQDAPHREKRMFIFGIGYVGLSLARHLQGQAWDVSGTCSHEDRREALQGAGFRAFRFNSDNDGEELVEEGMHAMRHSTHMVATIPPVADFDKDPVLSVYRQKLFHIATCMDLRWIGYLSSTGVYGDYQGEWVDENSQPKPVDKRAIARLEAEKAWLQLGIDSGACVQVFRLGGIYGPQRSAINTLLCSDKPSLKQHGREGRKYTSRIHVMDICQVIMASIQSPFPGRIYNVVDDEPASRTEVFSYARSLICDKWPSKMEKLMETENLGASYVKEEVKSLQRYPEKRVLNKRLKEDLKVELIYPSYKSGLKAVIDKLDQ